MRANEIINEDEPMRIKLSGNNEAAKAWIQKVYAKYPGTFQNNHVMTWGEGDVQQFAMFELVPSFSRRGAVEVKWFQAYPLRQGVGSRAMKELQALAREDGIELTLFPWDKGVVSQSKLTKFYKGQGFKPIQKGGKSMYWAQEKVAEDSYQPPSLEVGDKILKGKFKNSPAEIKGFTKDKHNQPVLKTNKGPVQLFKPRIVKLVKEEINHDILHPEFTHEQEIGDFVYTARYYQPMNFDPSSLKMNYKKRYWLEIVCKHGNKSIGSIIFEVKRTNDGMHLESYDTEVNPAYRNQGIASTMYAYAKMLGNDIKPSTVQLPDGKSMWAAWTKSGEAKHLTTEAEESVEKPMTQCSSQDLQKLLGKGKTNALIKHPWFQRYNNYEHAFKHGVDRWGFTKVEVYPFFSSVHTTAEGRLRPLTKMEFTFSYGGTKVVQVEEWYRAKEPDDNELRMGPGAGWRHMKTWATDKQDTVDKAWDKHWDNKEVKEEELTEYEHSTPASNQIIAKLKSLGYEQLGGGLDATVWSKDAGSVVKILMPSRTIPGRVSDAERGFLTFYEFCQEHSDSPNLPKFVDIGGAHHTVFEIDGIPYRQIAMERLKPLTPNSFESYMIGMLANLAKMAAPWGNVVNMLKRPSTWESTDVIAYRSMPDMVKRKFADPDAYKHWGMLYITIGRLYRSGLKAGLGWDLHGENVMQRNDGTVVITDPYFT